MDGESQNAYALDVADRAFDWYDAATARARRLHRSSEIAVIVVSALVPLSAVLAPGNAVLPALLGSVVVVITGLRSVFHWHENYLRFARAREAVEAERRRYRIGTAAYSDPATRDATLVETVTRIQQEETGQWLQIAAPKREPAGQ